MNKTGVAIKKPRKRKALYRRNSAKGVTRNGKDRQRNGANDSIPETPGAARAVGGLRGTRQEFDWAIQRYSDLYEFAPVGYITFDRGGRIQEANLAACGLLDIKRGNLIDTPFSLHVMPEDLHRFLQHLVRCRSGEHRVESYLHLKKKHGDAVSVYLSSTRTDTLYQGSVVYQTAIVDLTEREKTESALREKEAELERIITGTPFMLTRCTRDLRYRYVSHAYAKMVGRSAEELAGRAIVEILGEEGFETIRPYIKRVLAGETVSYESLVSFKEVGRRFLHGVYVPDKNERGEVVGWIASIIDITERKAAETAALRLAAVVQSSHDAIVAKDLNGIITDWNKSAERIFGYKAKEIIGKSILTVIPKDRQSEETEILSKIRRGESIDHYETVRCRKDGRLIDVALTISPVKDAKGKIVGVSKIARDITKQKQADRLLAEQARLLDLSNEAILVRDKHDRITYWNHGATELYGYTAKEALGKITHHLLRTKHSEPLKRIQSKLERDDRWSGELVHTRKDGKKIIVMSHWALDRDSEGKAASILETNTDISRRKKAETKLQKSKKMLELLVQHRTKGLRNANAELENEIGRRKGLEGQILEISDREQERLGQELHDGLCQQLTAIGFMTRAAAMRLKDHRVVQVEELEKISQLINGSVMAARNIAHDLHKEGIDAAGFENALRDLAERKIWRTPCHFRCDGALNIEDDRVASEIFRILREGIINANKHAQATEIVLEASRRKRELVFSVTDNGIGLNGQTPHGGGIGFHIMQYRAQSIGARFELESPRRGGTRVAVYLPITQ